MNDRQETPQVLTPQVLTPQVLGWCARLTVLMVTALAPLAVMAENAIQSITSTQQAGTEVIRVELAQALTELPKGFAVQTPPRVAISI